MPGKSKVGVMLVTIKAAGMTESSCSSVSNSDLQDHQRTDLWSSEGDAEPHGDKATYPGSPG